MKAFLIVAVLMLFACSSPTSSSSKSGTGNSTQTTSASTPSIPTGVAAVAATGKVTISWNTVSGATSYNVYRSTSSTVTQSNGFRYQGELSSPFVLTGLGNGSTYYFVVTAVNSGGESSDSSSVNATPLAVPTGVGITNAKMGTESQAEDNLTWATVPGADYYNVYYATSSGVTKASGTKTSVVSGFLQLSVLGNPIIPKTDYFIVIAVNNSGESSATSEVHG